MTAPIYPQFQVVPFTVTGANASTGYLLQMISGSPTAGPQPATTPDPTDPTLGFGSYANMIDILGLAAKINHTAFPYAYVVGTGANNFTTDALCKAAAEGDCNLLVTQRNNTLAASGMGPTNPFVTFGAPVLGPL